MLEENKNNFINIGNTRTDEQKKNMEQIQKDGVCPFCFEYLEKYHKRPILQSGKYWLVTENMYPYHGAKVHLIFINKIHTTHLNDISNDSWSELLKLYNWAISNYNIEGGSFLMRFGDTKFNGSSVGHLHAQLVVGDVDDPNHKPIRVKIG